MERFDNHDQKVICPKCGAVPNFVAHRVTSVNDAIVVICYRCAAHVGVYASHDATEVQHG